MNRRAFTLIEMMIVIALMAIIITFVHIGNTGFMTNISQKNEIIKNNDNLASFYLYMKTQLKNCDSVIFADEYIVKFKPDIVLRSLNNGHSVEFNDKLFVFGNNYKIWGYEKVDENTFSMQFSNVNENIRVFWRVGNE
ncbi:MAG: type II secretion system protein [Candidatus Riflebacteria bacterium]|nr:type II secretion system protein [Candidatus Riflebacteria bacterium]